MSVSAAIISLALVAIAGAGSSRTSAPLSHDDEIRLYASTMAIAKTASDTCADILINTPMLGGIKDRFHMSEADRSRYVNELDSVFATLSKAIADAPSQKAWCDNTYQLYGPDGSMIRGLMLR